MRKTTKFLSLLLTAALVGSVIFSGSAVKVSATTQTEQARLASTNGAEGEASTYEKEGRGKNLSPDAVYSENGKIHLYAKRVTNKSVWTYPQVTLSHNSRVLSSVGRLINGVTYIPVRSFFGEITSMKVTYNSSLRTLYVKGEGLDMEIIDGSNVIYANGRTIYSVTPNVIMNNGSMYAPISSIAKVLSLSYNENNS